MIINTIEIGNKRVGPNNMALIVAEAGVNYNNKLHIAYKMIDAAIKAKVDVIKFQSFIADEIQFKNSKKPQYQNKLKNQSYYQIIKSLEPSFDDQVKIFEYCKKRKILFLSTPYDIKSVDFLDDLGVNAFKIASTDLTNHILLKHVLSKRKPILLSTGLADLSMVSQAVKLFEKFRMKHNLILLQATSNYPTQEKDVNLKIIPEYMKKFNVLAGYSDHTLSGVAAYGAITMGAKVVEKHFTLSRKMIGPDHSSSLEPHELENWVRNIRLIEQALGTSKKSVTHSERMNASMRKVLTIGPMKKGSTISIELLGTKRTNGHGVLPLDINIKKIIGRKINRNVFSTTQFDWSMLL